MANMEHLHDAWNRYHDLYSTPNWRDRRRTKVPVRIRGYTQLDFDSLDKTWRRKIIKGINEGFVGAKNPAWVKCMRVMCAAEGLEIGYVGRTIADMSFGDKRDEYKNLMEAQVTMTGDFRPRNIRTYREGRIVIYLDSAISDSAFSNFRVLVRQMYADHPQAAEREQFARRLEQGGYILQIPFDSEFDED